MRVLVTGGAGFIGSHLVDALLAPGRREGAPVSVTVLDSLTYAGDPANLDAVRAHPGFRFVHGDITDRAVVDPLVAAHDAVVHLAAETHVDRSIASAGAFVRTNVVGTQTLLDAALRHRTGPFVHVSTDEVYGSVPSGRTSEEHPLAPSSPYAASKAAADLLALSYHRTHGLDVRVTRCSNNYGPRQFPEKLIPLCVTRLCGGGRIPLYGDGRNVRDWLHVEDHCRALLAVLSGGRPGHVYNIGGGTELDNTAVVGTLLEACGAGWDRVDRVADRPGHDRRYCVDWSKIHRELGYAPRRDFTAGIRETVEWYRAPARAAVAR
jgi:dTDP-glucose 4,6-dehydratase